MRTRSSVIFLFGVLAFVAHCQEEDEHEKEPEVGAEEKEAHHQVDGERLKEVHAAMDANKDGKVSKVEMHEFANKLRLAETKNGIASTIEEMDTDKDGKVSHAEYMKSNYDMEGLTEAEQKKQNAFEKQKFDVADRNRDGFLDADELPSMMNPQLNDDVLTLVVEREMKDRDKDGNGELTKEEFWVTTDGTTESDPEMLEEFKKLDKDNSGTINIKEYRHWESGLHHTEAALEKIFELADKDKDSHVNADELTGSTELHEHEVGSLLSEWVESHANHGGEL